MGFSNAAFTGVQAPSVPANLYADGQYWDDTLFALPTGARSADVTVYYQTSSKEYMEFLLNQNTTNTAGQTAYNQWVAKGKSAPVQVQLATLVFSAGAQFAPVSYGLAKRLSSASVPVLGYRGSPSISGGGLSLTVAQGFSNQLALALWNPRMASVPFQGGTRYVGSPIYRMPAIRLDANGRGTIAVPLSPALIGTVRNYQVMMVDPGDPYGVGLTNGLHVEFYP